MIQSTYAYQAWKERTNIQSKQLFRGLAESVAAMNIPKESPDYVQAAPEKIQARAGSAAHIKPNIAGAGAWRTSVRRSPWQYGAQRPAFTNIGKSSLGRAASNPYIRARTAGKYER
jgi:hypothetical protein